MIAAMPTPRTVKCIRPEDCSELKIAWDEAQYDPPYGAHGFPDSQSLSPTEREWADLLELCLNASLRADEARPTIFRIVFERDANEVSIWQLGHHDEIRLSNPIPATAKELVRFAHAASSKNCIWLRQKHSNGGYFITGISQEGRSVVLGKDLDVVDEGPPAPVPIIEVRGPGRMRVLKGTVAVAWFEYDTLGFVNTRPSSVDALKESVVPLCVQLREKVNGWLTCQPDQKGSAELDKFIEFKVLAALCRVVGRIIERAHGGLLVYLPDVKQTEDVEPLSERLNVKYRSDWFTTHKFPGDLVSLLYRQLNERFDFFRKAGSVAPSDGHRRAAERLEEDARGRAQIIYKRSCNTLGDLSGVDGAVLLAQDLGLIGFGVEILCKEGKPEDEYCWEFSKRIEADAMVPFKTYGTRHRSAFRLCREIPSAAAFVVSQDGPTKLVRNLKGQIVYWDHFERDLWTVLPNLS
jgi:hypothetical protein